MRVECEAQIVKCDVTDADNAKVQLKNVVLTIDAATLNMDGQRLYGVQPMSQAGAMFIIPELTVARGDRIPVDAAIKAEKIRKDKGVKR
ncbi:MAG: hypothetical protein ACI4RS_05435 [Monoglobaceae bacterium]